MMIVGYDHNILGHFTAITKEPKYFRFYNGERLHQSLDYKTPEAVYWMSA
jgi:hypothetical protein